ncbi:MAG: hypothetical protein P4M08_08860 [Oligoflexia bacterium]|nr:hypothetical protein [Oligoflexia bacterium]
MPSGWAIYYIVFLSALIALGIPATLALISSLVSSKRGPASPPAPPSRDKLGQRINARFFLGMNATLTLTALVLILIPCAGVMRNANGDRAVALRALLAIVSISGLAGLGLLYSSRKGDLRWIHSFQRPEDDSAEGSAGGLE